AGTHDWPCSGMSLKLVNLPPFTTGRMKQSDVVFGEMDHPVAGWPGRPTSAILQVVEPWSKAQLWPPTIAGRGGVVARVVDVPVGELFSVTELSGMKTDPAVPVKMPGAILCRVAGRFPDW